MSRPVRRHVSTPLAALACAAALAVPDAARSEDARRTSDVQADAHGGYRTPDVVYVPTPDSVVAAMLDVAKVGKGDVVYDLGCGDGRIVVAAAKRGAKKAIGVDIDPERVQEARANVARAGVGDRAQIVEGDLFKTNLQDATVVTLYLLPDLNLRLRPKLLALKPGTRIVSHAFDMGDWKPEKELQVDGKNVYFWTVPAKAEAHPAAR
jgi:SAM-dependent methyltransferase